MAKEKVHIYANAKVTGKPEGFIPVFEEAMPDKQVVYWATQEQFIDGLDEAKYLAAFDPPKGHWTKAVNLRLLQGFGAGIDNLLPADGLPETVAVANAKGVAAEPMSDFGLALVLMMSKNLHRAISNQRNKVWKAFMPGDIPSQTLGIMGLGAIGTPLARKGKQLGFRIAGFNHTRKPNEFTDEAYGLSDIDDFLSTCDIIVILLPITDETRNLMSRARLNKLKPGASIVNLGRGGIVDETALLEKLKDGSLGGAAFDVFEQEPLPPDNPLWEAPNLFITPHNGGLFPNYFQELVKVYAQNIACVEAGKPPLTEVDMSRGY